MPTNIIGKGEEVAKAEEEFNAYDKMMLEKTTEAKLIKYNVLCLGKINRISTCNTPNKICERLLPMHEETHSDMTLMVLINTDSEKSLH